MFSLWSTVKIQTCLLGVQAGGKACFYWTALDLHPCRWLIMHILRMNLNVFPPSETCTLPCKHIRGCFIESSRLTKRMLNPVCYGRRRRSPCVCVWCLIHIGLTRWSWGRCFSMAPRDHFFFFFFLFSEWGVLFPLEREEEQFVKVRWCSI